MGFCIFYGEKVPGCQEKHPSSSRWGYELGEPVCLLKLSKQVGFFVDYQDVDESLADRRVFELYDNIVLTDIVECAFILLDGVLKDYRGHIICLGPGWKDFEKLLPGRNNIEFADEVGDISTYIDLEKTMWLSQFGSAMAGYEERCQKGFFSYDEIMTLVYICLPIEQKWGIKILTRNTFSLIRFFQWKA